MSDDNFFNKSINEESATGFAASLTESGEVPTGTTFIDTTDNAVAATFPPASVGPGVSVTLVVSNLTNATTAVAAASPGTDTFNTAASPAALAAIGVYTFVSDGIGNWTYTA